jgi:hypothetical protein
MKTINLLRAVLLLFALLISVGMMQLRAQSVVQLPTPWHFFRGNPSPPQRIVLGSNPGTVTAVLYNYQRSGVLAGAMQPAVARTDTSAVLTWTANQTQQLPEISFLQVRVDGVTAYVTNIYTDKLASSLSPATSLSVVYPSGMMLPADALASIDSLSASLSALSEQVVPKISFQPVASFSAAKAAITPGTPAQFRIATNELFGAPTSSTYDGANWYHCPALLLNNE